MHPVRVDVETAILIFAGIIALEHSREEIIHTYGYQQRACVLRADAPEFIHNNNDDGVVGGSTVVDDGRVNTDATSLAATTIAPTAAVAEKLGYRRVPKSYRRLKLVVMC